jgi:hypothetical protein
MILFYSSQCNHCSMLLQTLKIHDKDKKIKLLSIDYLKSNNYKIDHRITHVPALLISNEDRFIFGKNILDLLFIPNKGILLNNNDNDNNNNNNNNINTIVNNQNLNEPNEPNGLFSDISQNFESIDNINNVIGPVSIWEEINNNNNNNNNNTTIINNNQEIIANDDTDKSHKKLPSIAEIQEMRNKDI